MATYLIEYTDLIGCTNQMDWEPRSSNQESLADSDVQFVLDYIRTGKWDVNTTAAAKNCYDQLVDLVATGIAETALDLSEHATQLVMAFNCYNANNRLSAKGRLLLERILSLWQYPQTPENGEKAKKLFTRIVKCEKAFDIALASSEAVERMRCCICGRPITDRGGHNPYPVRPESWYGEKENRCCIWCNYRIVIPARLRACKEAPNVSKLMEMDYQELLEYVQS